MRMKDIIRFEGVYMKNKLKAIINEFGLNALAYPDDLCATMRDRGIPEKDVLTVQMILKCCPSVAGVLISGNVTEAEMHVLIRSAVQKTGLSSASVRFAVGMLMDACGYEAEWKPYLISHEKKSRHKIVPVTPGEGESLEDLEARLADDPNSADVLSDLNKLAEQGNVDANYKLGQHYKYMDDVYSTETGLPYFERAAELGFGPANGAVADYLIRREHKNMEKVAGLFRYPTALAGKEGREWTKISALVLNYQQDNKARQRSVLTSQLIFLALAFAAVLISGGFGNALGFLCVASVAIQAAAIFWSLYIMVRKPLASVKYAYYAMTLGCLLLILGMF